MPSRGSSCRPSSERSLALNAVSLPIFPLPDLTFFPHSLLPLHIFEARYRAMITDCMGRDRQLAVVGLKPGYETIYDGRPPVYAIGRFNILLKGERRVRIEREMPADTLYRMVVATPLEDVGADRPSLPGLAGDVRERCLQILEALGRGSREMRESLEA